MIASVTTTIPAKLGADGSGLTQQEAKRRLAQFGYNELPKKKRNLRREFLVHFWGPIALMIERSVLAND
jgi:H+-transporting ATPase